MATRAFQVPPPLPPPLRPLPPSPRPPPPPPPPSGPERPLPDTAGNAECPQVQRGGAAPPGRRKKTRHHSLFFSESTGAQAMPPLFSFLPPLPPSSLLPACLSRILLETPNNPGPLPFPTRPDERPRCNNAPTLWWKSQQPRSPHCPDGSRCKCLIPQLPRLLLKPPTTPAPVQSTGNGRSSIKSSENREENPPSSTPAKNIRIYHLMIR